MYIILNISFNQPTKQNLLFFSNNNTKKDTNNPLLRRSKSYFVITKEIYTKQNMESYKDFHQNLNLTGRGKYLYSIKKSVNHERLVKRQDEQIKMD